MLLFLQLVNTLADGSNNPDFQSEMNRVSLWFVYLAIASLVASFLEISMFMWSGALLDCQHSPYLHCIAALENIMRLSLCN